MEYQKLYRSRSNRVITGVAGGLGEFFAIDPVIVRIIFVLLTVLGGSGILIYLLLLIFIPTRPLQEFETAYANSESQAQQQGSAAYTENASANISSDPDEIKIRHKRSSMFGAIILITIGVLFLVDMFKELDCNIVLPIILIITGISLLFYRKSR